MALWWLGNIVLIAVVVPVLITILRRVIAPAEAIASGADELAKAGSKLVSDLDAVAALVATRRLVAETGAGLARYGGALDEIL